MAKVIMLLVAAVLATVVAARLAYNLSTASDGAPTNQPWVYDKMEFVAWNGEKWTAWIRDGRFELVPRNPGKWSRHSNVSLAFIDWAGEPWQAKIDGEMFLLAHRGDWKGPTKRAAAIRYRDWSGRQQLRTVAQLQR
ncbi:MAG TPA: hypothetical protein VM616_07430 [Gammaproteobacteria bacterium]|nr:hypothetical protein [Gammaproteobacteria bacterium]